MNSLIDKRFLGLNAIEWLIEITTYSTGLLVVLFTYTYGDSNIIWKILITYAIAWILRGFAAGFIDALRIGYSEKMPNALGDDDDENE